MVDRDTLVELAPHYLAMLVLAFTTLLALRVFAGALNFWIETAIVVVALLLYRPIVLYLGIAPSMWRRG